MAPERYNGKCVQELQQHGEQQTVAELASSCFRVESARVFLRYSFIFSEKGSETCRWGISLASSIRVPSVSLWFLSTLCNVTFLMRHEALFQIKCPLQFTCDRWAQAIGDLFGQCSSAAWSDTPDRTIPGAASVGQNSQDMAFELSNEPPG